MQEYQAAKHFAEQAENVIFGVRGMIWDAWLCFYHALALAAVSDALNPDEKNVALEKIESLGNRMRIWSDNAPQNFAQQYELIEAEVARTN